MSSTLAAAYMLVSVVTGNGTAAVVIPFASFTSCLQAMRNMAVVDAPGLDPRPEYCFDATTGEVVVP